MRNKDSNKDIGTFSLDNPIKGISDSLRDENSWNAGDASVFNLEDDINHPGGWPIGYPIDDRPAPGCCSGGGSGSIIEESEIVL